MTIDEAIKHCEEVAEELDMKAGFETDNERYAMSESERDQCKECASEHRQLAEWLKELKVYKANREGYCSWCSNLKDRHLRIEYYWIDDEGNTASYVGKTNQVATGIARFCPCCGRFIEMEVNADERRQL